mgnify:CR=1 FL=1
MNYQFKKPVPKKFPEIDVGDCFQYASDLYIKIRNSNLDNNAFNVSENKVMTIYKDTVVIPRTMKLIEQ